MSDQIYRTRRLSIRPWKEVDLPRFFETYSDPDVTRYIPSLHVTTGDEALDKLRVLETHNSQYGENYGIWAAERTDNGLVVGTVMLKYLPGFNREFTNDIEVGWHLTRDSWRQGYATEMSEGAIHYGFTACGLSEIFAIADAENSASIQVMKRLGMHYVGPNTRYYDGEEGVIYKLERPFRST